MTDWTDIHEDFGNKPYSSNETYQQKWEKANITKQEAKEWIELGFKPDDLDKVEQWKNNNFTPEEAKSWIGKEILATHNYDFAYFLKKDGYKPTDLNKNNLEQLKKVVSWKDIHKDFGRYFSYRKEWENQGFNYSETKQLIEMGFFSFDSQFAKQWKDSNFSLEGVETWMKVGLNSRELNFANYLKQNNYQPTQLTANKLFNLRKEFYLGFPQAQSYLEKNYPCDCSEKIKNQRPYHQENCLQNKLKELNLRNFNLEGDLDLRKFRNLWKICLAGNPNLGEVNKDKRDFFLPEFSCRPSTLIYQNTPQEFLNHQYPNKGQAEEINLNNLDFEQPSEQSSSQLILDNYPNLKKISISEFENLQELTLHNLPNLKEFYCHLNCCWDKRTNLGFLDLTDCPNLQTIKCDSNWSWLTQIKLPKGEKIEELNLRNNNFNQDLSFLKDLVNLEKLNLEGNSFFGSLEPLKNMSKLETLNISDTDIDSGLEFLPESVKEFVYSDEILTKNKVKVIWDLLANEQGKLELGGSLWVKTIVNFPQKLQALKNNWIELGFTDEEMKTWTSAGAKLDDYNYPQKWRNHDFTDKQAQEWVKFGAKTHDYKFVAWLRDIKNYEPKWISNYQGDYRELSQRFKKYSLCSECNQPNTGEQWCKDCNSKHLRENFTNWTSHNPQIDQFIQKYQLEATEVNKFLEWIPYEHFKDIEYLTKGGFGKVYKAKWVEGSIHHWDAKNKKWKREKDYYYENKDKWGENEYYDYESKEYIQNKKYKTYREIVLKSLNNSSNNTEFLSETEKHKIIDDWFNNIVPCYGLSQDPKTGNYLMVMKYIPEGNLRHYLNNKNRELTLKDKINHLAKITQGLKDIHSKNLIHRDLHSGNILKEIEQTSCLITDLGLCKPANIEDKGDIYGVMPYVAPEILNSKPYTQTSDIYSFGMIAYEIFSGLPPYYDVEHDVHLAIKIIDGMRPKFQIKIPQLLENLIKKCWDANPEKRPTASELEKILRGWRQEINPKNEYDSESENEKETYQSREVNIQFQNQLQEAEEFNKILPEEIKYPDYKNKKHTEAVYTSRLLPTKEISKMISHSSKKISEQIYNEYISTELVFDIDIEKSKEISQEELMNRTKRQLSLETQTKTIQVKDKLIRTEEYYSEPMEIDNHTSLIQDWKNIHSDFTPKLTQQWQKHNFTFEQCQDWINVGLKPTDANFCVWLRDNKNYTSEQVLNHGNLEQLNQEYFQRWQQQQLQAQIQIFPKQQT